jgi:AraC-like DNA-binding protein
VVSESARSSPAPALRDLIARYDGYRQQGVAPARHLGLPSPFMTLIVTLQEPLQIVEHVDRGRPASSYRSLVGGLHTTPAVIAHDGSQSGIQLRVSPIASRALFGMPAGELAGTDLAADEVLGRSAGELHERISAATSWTERFRILDVALTARLGDSLPPAPVINAWALLTRSHGLMPISKLAREVGWSERQLAKRFGQEIGLSPKLAARMIRFDRARHALQSQLSVRGRTDIAWIAAGCGYHDQSHLVRDFRSFTRLPPSRWLAQEFGNVQAKPAFAV